MEVGRRGGVGSSAGGESVCVFIMLHQGQSLVLVCQEHDTQGV